jgi:hypothetical protein
MASKAYMIRLPEDIAAKYDDGASLCGLSTSTYLRSVLVAAAEGLRPGIPSGAAGIVTTYPRGIQVQAADADVLPRATRQRNEPPSRHQPGCKCARCAQ